MIKKTYINKSKDPGKSMRLKNNRTILSWKTESSKKQQLHIQYSRLLKHQTNVQLLSKPSSPLLRFLFYFIYLLLFASHLQS